MTEHYAFQINQHAERLQAIRTIRISNHCSMRLTACGKNAITQSKLSNENVPTTLCSAPCELVMNEFKKLHQKYSEDFILFHIRFLFTLQFWAGQNAMHHRINYNYQS